MANRKFGKFASIDAFLESYKSAQENALTDAEKDMPFEEKVQNRRTQTRPVVEVSAKLHTLESDGQSLHVQMLITIEEVLKGNAAVADDVQRVLTNNEDVFLAVRVGDSMGITKPIVGLVAGVGLKVQGEWIPKDKAFAHGGEKMSVLHFTHHPLGFICVETPAACYQ